MNLHQGRTHADRGNTLLIVMGVILVLGIALASVLLLRN
jgi:hypothetical protein